MKGLKGGRNAHHDYHSVEDQKDLRIPVQNEDAFKVGILYKAKVSFLYTSVTLYTTDNC